jgi:DNA-directed RNA polymerase subunit RPC12/RpoP
MPDIIFKCEACRNHLIVDEARRGMSVECPKCHAVITIPSALVVYQCPQCQQRLMLSSEMKGERVHCSSCRAEIRLPEQLGGEGVRESPVVFVCPECRAEVEVPEGSSDRSAPCPNCGKQVRFQTRPRLDGIEKGEPPIPKEQDRSLFKRKPR